MCRRPTYYWVVHEGFIGVFNGTLDDPTYSELGDDNETQQFQSTGGWLGITDKYWMAAVIPPQSEQFNATYKAFDANGTKAYQSDFILKPEDGRSERLADRRPPLLCRRQGGGHRRRLRARRWASAASTWRSIGAGSIR